MIALAENNYGKSRVRLAKVKRHADHHDFCEWTLEILLEGDFESCFVAGDNSKILPTDTMKNTVYSLARTSSTAVISITIMHAPNWDSRSGPCPTTPKSSS